MFRLPHLIWASLAVLVLLAPVAKAQPAQRKVRKVALLVGPSTYLHDFKPLPFLDDDVKALAVELKKGGFEEIIVLTDPPEGKNPATKKNILLQLDRLTRGDGNETRALRKDDVFFLALSGHGQEVFVNKKTKDTFFAPIDGKQNEPQSLLNLGEVLEKLAAMGSNNVILADMCRDVYDPNKGTGLDIDNLRLPKNCAILFGCESTEKSFVNTELKHSLFTYAVLEVLRESHANQQELLWSELVSGVEKKFRTKEYRDRMEQGKQQTPVPRVTDLKATPLIAAVANRDGPKPNPPKATVPVQPPADSKDQVEIMTATTGFLDSEGQIVIEKVISVNTRATVLEVDEKRGMIHLKLESGKKAWVDRTCIKPAK